MPTIAMTPLSFYSGMRNKNAKVPLAQFRNPDFDLNFDFWDVYLQWQTPGQKVSNPKANRTILGWPIPPKANDNPKNYFGMQSGGQTERFPNYTSTDQPGWTWQANILTGGPSGNYAELKIGSGSVDGGGKTVFGPALVSQDAVIGNVGDKIAFNWYAEGSTPTTGGDAYNVLAYIIDAETGKYHIMLDENADIETKTTPWAEASKILGPGEKGNYYFVFICGSFDASFGGAVGAKLYVDSIRRYKAGTY